MRVLKFVTMIQNLTPNTVPQSVTATFVPGGNTLNVITRKGSGRPHVTTHTFTLGIMGWNDTRVRGFLGNTVSTNLMSVPTHNLIGS
jgi:hypothetical protein